MSKLTYFDYDRINPDLHPSWTWLRKVEDKNKPMCIKFRMTFSLSNMGCQASTNQATVLTYFFLKKQTST